MKGKGLVAGPLILMTALFASGCNDGYWPKMEQTLKGTHKLRKMTESAESNSRISGGFFLFIGGVSGKTTAETSVKFAWEMNDGTYALSSLPLEKIRVKLDEKATTPTIEFNLGRRPSRIIRELTTLSNLQAMMKEVYYALVTVRERDWPVKINLPLNSQ